MKVIAGKFKGRKLQTIEHENLRPSMMKTKEAIFSILTSLDIIHEAIVLDLCCGVGAFGIECLSRGASFVTFVDQEKKILQMVEQNTAKLDIKDSYEIITSSILNLKKITKQYNLIFLDPPYKTDLAKKFLENINQYNFISPEAIIVVESLKLSDYSNFKDVEMIKEKIYGNTKVSILQFKGKL